MKYLFEFFNFLTVQEKKYSVLNLSAQLSYRVLLAFIPFTMLLYNFLNWFSTEMNDTIIHGIKILFPKFADDFINTAANSVPGPQTSLYANLVFGFFILYASICALRSLILTVNKVMNIQEKRNFFMVWTVSFLYLCLFIILILVFLYLYIFTQHIVTDLFASLNLSVILIRFWSIFSLMYVGALGILFLTGIYMFIPSKHLSFFSALPGAIFVGTGWFLILGVYQIFIWSDLDLTSFVTSLEGPFSIIIFIYIFCIVLCFGCVVNLFFIKRAEVAYEK